MSSTKSASSRADRPGAGRLLLAWARNHLVVAADSLGRIRRTPLQSGLMIAVIAIAASLPASLYLLAGTVKSISGDVSRTADIQVYFSASASSADIDAFVQHWEQSAPSEDIALNEAVLDNLVVFMAAQPGVDQVEYDFAWLERLDALLTLVDRLNLVIGIMLGAGIVLVLINSIRLMIDNRRDEIVIVKLVGGTNEFVRRPLLYTGFWLGLLGGLAAILVTDAAVLALGSPLRFLLGSYALSGASIAPLSLLESLTLLLISAGLGLAGAWLAVARHLSAIEPR